MYFVGPTIETVDRDLRAANLERAGYIALHMLSCQRGQVAVDRSSNIVFNPFGSEIREQVAGML